MIATTSTTYLITGANRGLGRGLLEAYLSRPNSTVIAGVRDPDAQTSQSLHALKKPTSSHLILVKIDSASATDAEAAVSTLREQYNIHTLDVVIANAGIANALPYVHEAKAEDMLEHFSVNVIGVVTLFRAVRPLLLENCAKGKVTKFITMSSGAGSIERQKVINLPNAAYGTSKAALNYITEKIHMENQEAGLIAFPIDPGWVQTDMGNAGAKAFGFEKAELLLEESVNGMIKVIEDATEATSGRFMIYNGTESPW